MESDSREQLHSRKQKNVSIDLQACPTYTRDFQTKLILIPNIKHHNNYFQNSKSQKTIYIYGSQKGNNLVPSPSLHPLVPSPTLHPFVPSPSQHPLVSSPSLHPLVPSPNSHPLIPSLSPHPLVSSLNSHPLVSSHPLVPSPISLISYSTYSSHPLNAYNSSNFNDSNRNIDSQMRKTTPKIIHSYRKEKMREKIHRSELSGLTKWNESCSSSYQNNLSQCLIDQSSRQNASKMVNISSPLRLRKEILSNNQNNLSWQSSYKLMPVCKQKAIHQINNISNAFTKVFSLTHTVCGNSLFSQILRNVRTPTDPQTLNNSRENTSQEKANAMRKIFQRFIRNNNNENNNNIETHSKSEHVNYLHLNSEDLRQEDTSLIQKNQFSWTKDEVLTDSQESENIVHPYSRIKYSKRLKESLELNADGQLERQLDIHKIMKDRQERPGQMLKLSEYMEQQGEERKPCDIEGIKLTLQKSQFNKNNQLEVKIINEDLNEDASQPQKCTDQGGENEDKVNLKPKYVIRTKMSKELLKNSIKLSQDKLRFDNQLNNEITKQTSTLFKQSKKDERESFNIENILQIERKYNHKVCTKKTNERGVSCGVDMENDKFFTVPKERKEKNNSRTISHTTYRNYERNRTAQSNNQPENFKVKKNTLMKQYTRNIQSNQKERKTEVLSDNNILDQNHDESVQPWSRQGSELDISIF